MAADAYVPDPCPVCGDDLREGPHVHGGAWWRHVQPPRLESRPSGPPAPVRRFDQRGGVHPPGVVCRCERDFLTLTLEESCQPCPCARKVRVWRRDLAEEGDDAE